MKEGEKKEREGHSRKEGKRKRSEKRGVGEKTRSRKRRWSHDTDVSMVR